MKTRLCPSLVAESNSNSFSGKVKPEVEPQIGQRNLPAFFKISDVISSKRSSVNFISLIFMFSAVKLSNPAKRAKDSQVRSETGGGS